MKIDFLVQHRIRGIDGRWGLWHTLTRTPNSVTASDTLIGYVTHESTNSHFVQYRIDAEVDA